MKQKIAVALATLVVAMGLLAYPRWWKAVKPAPSTAPAAPHAAPGDAAIAMNGSRPLIPPIRLELVGQVSGVPAGGAVRATVFVGAMQLTPSVASDGSFRAVVFAEPGDMVRVVADAPRVHYMADAGSVGLLRQLSGGDGVVDPSEQPALQTSPLSTATAVLVRRVLGREARDDRELELAQRSLGSHVASYDGSLKTDINRLAVVMDRAAAGALALPTGYATGYDLVQDESRLRAVLNGVGVEEAARAYPFDVTVPAVPAGTRPPADWLLVSGMKPQDPTLGLSYVGMFSRNAAGRYVLNESEMGSSRVLLNTAPDEYDFESRQGEWVLMPATSGMVERESSQDGSRVLQTTRSIRFRRLTQGPRYALWASRREYSERYPDDPLRPTVERVDFQVIAGADFARVTRTDGWSPIPYRVALPTECLKAPTITEFPGAQVLVACEYAQHRLDAGGSGMTEEFGSKVNDYMKPQPAGFGTAFNWAVMDAGARLRITTQDTQLDFWKLDGPAADVESIVFLARNRTGQPAGQTRLGVTVAIPVAEVVPYTAAVAAGTWTFAPSAAPGLPYPTENTAYTLTRDGTGKGDEYFSTIDPDGSTYEGHILFSWQMMGGVSYDTRYRARFPTTGTRYVTSCAEAFSSGATECAPWRVRYFRPLKRAGTRYYGIAEFATQSALTGPTYTGSYSVRRSSSPQYYVCQSGGCATPAAAGQPALVMGAPGPHLRGARSEMRNSDADLRVRVHRLRP